MCPYEEEDRDDSKVGVAEAAVWKCPINAEKKPKCTDLPLLAAVAPQSSFFSSVEELFSWCFSEGSDIFFHPMYSRLSGFKFWKYWSGSCSRVRRQDSNFATLSFKSEICCETKAIFFLCSLLLIFWVFDSIILFLTTQSNSSKFCKIKFDMCTKKYIRPWWYTCHVKLKILNNKSKFGTGKKAIYRWLLPAVIHMERLVFLSSLKWEKGKMNYYLVTFFSNFMLFQWTQ